MTILQVASGTSAYGGEKILLSLSNYLRNKGHRVIILSPGMGELISTGRMSGHEVAVIPMRKTYDITAMFHLCRFIKKEKIDIVHSHGLLVNIISRLAAFISGCKSVNTIHIIQHLSNGAPALARKIRNIYYKILDNFTARFCQKIIAVSNAVERDLVRQGLRRDKLLTVYNGIEGIDSTVRKEKKILKQFGIGEGDKVISLVGRIIPLKGHDDFIDAARILIRDNPHLRFLIAGEDIAHGGKYLNLLKGRVRGEGMEGKVIFTGFIKSVRELMADFDVFVLPAWEEPFGLVVLEAMSAGVPVVATDSGGVPEIIKDGWNGLLVPPHSPEALSEAILKIINDSSLANALSREGLKTVRNFTVEKMAKAVEDIYFSIL